MFEDFFQSIQEAQFLLVMNVYANRRAFCIEAVLFNPWQMRLSSDRKYPKRSVNEQHMLSSVQELSFFFFFFLGFLLV